MVGIFHVATFRHGRVHWLRGKTAWTDDKAKATATAYATEADAIQAR
jgi:hypothetical protein